MNVLILGGGGREHAIAWKVSQSSILHQLYVAPGNAGTAELATNVELDPMDFPAISAFCLKQGVTIVVVGPEAPLVDGIVDFFAADKKLHGITVIGPSSKGAQLEGSKAFAKAFMVRHQIPTARYGAFNGGQTDEAIAFLKKLKPPYVLKADGLAAGKGVVILDELEEATEVLTKMLSGKAFGKSGERVVIEEFLKGTEVSMFILTDGHSFKLLPEAKDYKRVGEGDTGLNTGGMGAVSPVSFVNPEFMEKVKNQILIPTVKGLAADGIAYKGFIFFGLMKVQGDPYVIEYNCRLGDPETEVILPRIKSDLLHLFEGIATDTLSECDLEIDDRAASTVILASGGYPESYKKGKTIHFGDLGAANIFHSGTTLAKNGSVLTNGGRVLAVSATGAEVGEALKKSYKAAENIQFEGVFYRKDIGHDLQKVTAKS